jgi:hypothetical protein
VVTTANATDNVKYELIETYRLAASETITFGKPIVLDSNGYASASSTSFDTSVIGFAAEAKTSTATSVTYLSVIRKGKMKFTGMIKLVYIGQVVFFMLLILHLQKHQ